MIIEELKNLGVCEEDYNMVKKTHKTNLEKALSLAKVYVKSIYMCINFREKEREERELLGIVGLK